MKQDCIRCVVQLFLDQLNWKDFNGRDIHLEGPPVFLRACLLGQLQHSHLHTPVFPLSINQHLTFDRVLTNCRNPSLFNEVIRGEHVKLEIIQVTPDYKGGKILAKFKCPAHQFLFPKAQCRHGDGDDNLRTFTFNCSRQYQSPPTLDFASSTTLLEATVHSPVRIIFPKTNSSTEETDSSQENSEQENYPGLSLSAHTRQTTTPPPPARKGGASRQLFSSPPYQSKRPLSKLPSDCGCLGYKPTIKVPGEPMDEGPSTSEHLKDILIRYGGGVGEEEKSRGDVVRESPSKVRFRDHSPSSGERKFSSPVDPPRGASRSASRDVSPVGVSRGVSPVRTSRGVSLVRTSRGMSPVRTSRGMSPVRTSRGMSPVRMSRGVSPVRTSRGVYTVRMSRGVSPVRTSRGVSTVRTSRGVSPVRMSRDVSTVRRTSRGMSPVRTSRGVSPVRMCRDVCTVRTSRGVSPVRMCRDVCTVRTSRSVSPVRTSRSITFRSTVRTSPIRTSRGVSPVRKFSSPVDLPRGASRGVSPVRTFRGMSPVRTFRGMSPVRTFRGVSPVRTFRGMSPVRTFRGVSPVRKFSSPVDPPRGASRGVSHVRTPRGVSPVRTPRGERKFSSPVDPPRDVSRSRSASRGVSPVGVSRGVAGDRYYKTLGRRVGPHSWCECPRRSSPERCQAMESLFSPQRRSSSPYHKNCVPIEDCEDTLLVQKAPPDHRPPFVIRHVDKTLLSQRNFCGEPYFDKHRYKKKREMSVESKVRKRGRRSGYLSDPQEDLEWRVRSHSPLCCKHYSDSDSEEDRDHHRSRAHRSRSSTPHHPRSPSPRHPHSPSPHPPRSPSPRPPRSPSPRPPRSLSPCPPRSPSPHPTHSPCPCPPTRRSYSPYHKDCISVEDKLYHNRRMRTSGTRSKSPAASPDRAGGGGGGGGGARLRTPSPSSFRCISSLSPPRSAPPACRVCSARRDTYRTPDFPVISSNRAPSYHHHHHHSSCSTEGVGGGVGGGAADVVSKYLHTGRRPHASDERGGDGGAVRKKCSACEIEEKIEKLKRECCECLHSAESLGDDNLSEDLERLQTSLQAERDEVMEKWARRRSPSQRSGTVKIGPRDYWCPCMAEFTGKRNRALFDESLEKIYNRLYTQASMAP